ncbi:hypothetical protein TWF192_005802 [Orbilia oligospora]|uniref:Uroporphyrin-III C-methyltransferase n=1 Tax=Orbilia oligospora TaxID=2813651 RepID=A0A6G1MM10_ORBOL|nr:hypothetical protein TWF191_009743 [Orbilia oligospora]KAF3263522.1 hypothetical protein TWF192_005802 [Orbilia oligospora]
MTAPEYPSATILPSTSTTTTTNININNITTPTYTPSLLTATPSKGHIHLIIGCNALASARCTRSLEVGALPTVIFPETLDSEEVHLGLKKRIEDGEVGFVNRVFEVMDLKTLGREEVEHFVDAVFVTAGYGGGGVDASMISKTCARLRIPVNVVDSTSLSTFTLLSTYSDGPLQIGITTSGMGCKLASRLRRTVASALPVGIGGACERLGGLRRRVIDEDLKKSSPLPPSFNSTSENEAVVVVEERRLAEEEEEDDSTDQKSTFNALIQPDDLESQKSRRIRWLSQICEYWPLQKLVDLTEEDISNLFDEYSTSTSTPLSTSSTQGTETEKPKGTISLIGSGPGNPSLLTKASLDALLSADLILADKLVPSQILSLVPRRSTLFIARKFPGNAEAAQLELLEKGLEAIQRGQKVVRLKQGDPYIYGRGAEEYQWFEKMGVKIEVLPGITSALSAPLYAAIPSTHRAVADQILICTGTGRKGVPPDPPVYVKSQTTVFLMACHRLASLVDGLVKTKGWPEEVPCAVIERASCEDQRVVRSTLKNIVAAIEEVGSRPPGLFVVGWACEVLKKVDGPWSVEEGL